MSALFLVRGVVAVTAALATLKLLAVLQVAMIAPPAAAWRGPGAAPQASWASPQLVSPALANTPPGEPVPTVRPPAAQPGERPAGAPADAAEASLAAALRARREALDERERALVLREAVVEATERRLSARVAELTALQRTMEAQERSAQDREDASWNALARLYEAMRPREAAIIFNQLDMPILVQVVNRMAHRRAAPVLAAMEPDRARQLTAELTRLRASGPQSAAATTP
jgi:flagellar motility protein MotE (MotC chaperone)